MQEILEEIIELQFKYLGCAPNFGGASSDGRDEGGHSYATRAVNSSRPSRQRHDRGEIPDADMEMTYTGRPCGRDVRADREGRYVVARRGGGLQVHGWAMGPQAHAGVMI